MAELTKRVSAAGAVASRHGALAMVPFLSTFLEFSNLRKVLAFDGSHVGLTFRFPTAIVDYWTFASVPNVPGGPDTGGTVLFLPIVVLVQAGLVAGYLGSIREAMETGTFDFAANVRRYYLPMLGWALLAVLLGSSTVLLGAVGGSRTLPILVVLLVPVYLVLSYLFYATPYLIVLRDTGLEQALRSSYAYAMAGGEYGAFAVEFLVAVVVLSVVGTFFVNAGAFGVLAGALLAAPIGLLFNVAVMTFVRDLDRSAGAESTRPRT